MFASRKNSLLASLVVACLALAAGSNRVPAQTIAYQPRMNAAPPTMAYSDPEPAPRMMRASEAMEIPMRSLTPDERYRPGRTNERLAARRYHDSMRFADRTYSERELPSPITPEPVTAGPPDGFPYETHRGGPRPERGFTGGGYYGDGHFADGSFAESQSDEGRYYDDDQYFEGGQYDSGFGCGCGEGCIDDEGDDHEWLHCLWNKLCPCPYLHSEVPKCYLLSGKFWQNFNEFGGAQAFKGPVDRGVNGNFGFNKGINWAHPFCDKLGIGMQLGALIALSDLDGNGAPFHTRRDQYFVTAGLFRRANCNRGLQGGAVFDYLHDEYYVTMNMMQVRSEISYLWSKHELGVWVSAHTNSDTQVAPSFFNTTNVTWQVNDQYNMFYRRRFCNGGVGRMWVGIGGHGGVLFGCDGTAPLSERWAIQAAYNYLMPNNSSNVPTYIAESWNLTIGLCWYPGYKVPNACFNPYRPLFSVADNGSMMMFEK